MNDFIEALNIFAKYFPNGLQTGYFMSAEHDQIWIHVTETDCPEDSEDGRRLIQLGFHTDKEYWSMFV